MNVLLEALAAAPDDAAALKPLASMDALIVRWGGLPEGLKKQDFITTVRKKKADFKAKKMWGTPVEIAYEKIIYSIGQAQSTSLNVPGGIY